MKQQYNQLATFDLSVKYANLTFKLLIALKSTNCYAEKTYLAKFKRLSLS